jgi:vanillate O-demethylase monooxygenase subunit
MRNARSGRMIARVSPKALLYWHPVVRSADLGKVPLQLTLSGVELVVYRTADGRAAALDSRCPHRKMPLALGRVEGDRLVCPYHGWSFGPDGKGHSPATPAMKIATACYEVQELHGMVWLRAAGSQAAALPEVSFPGYFPLSILHHRVNAPFQLLIDNMAELEHTGSVHSAFGFPLERLHEIKTETSVLDDELDIYYEGPQRRLPLHLSLPTGIKANDRFVQYAKLRFGPVHANYDLQWWAPDTGNKRPLELKFVIFFNPVTDSTCEQFTFVLAKSPSPVLAEVVKRFKFLLVNSFDKELSADIRLVESLRLTPQQYNDYLPSRFDRPIREAAALIDRLYFQNNPAQPITFLERQVS